MYNKFFGFKEKPFKLVPNPEYLFLSKSHEEILAHLTYAISQGEGFVEITGEVGTGKTTLCRAFLESLDKSIEAAYIFNPTLDALQLLKVINDEFGIDSTPDNTKDLIDNLNAFLIAKKGAGQKILVLIDEAQNLSLEVLEQLRLLSNLETTQKKLLHIILVGQPELGEILSSHQLRQLGQRITINCRLAPLTFQETRDYIRHRISLASHRAGPHFDKASCRAIYKFSKGVPRLINIACDRALLNGFTRNSFNITASITKEALRELAPEKSGSSSRWLQGRSGLIVLTAVLALLAIVLLSVFRDQPLKTSVVDHVFVFSRTLLSEGKEFILKNKKVFTSSKDAAPPAAQSTVHPEAAILPGQPPEASAVDKKKGFSLADGKEQSGQTGKALSKLAVRKDEQDFLKYLKGLNPRNSRSRALQETLKLWFPEEEVMVAQREIDADPLFFQATTMFYDLQILHLVTDADLALVQKINLPAIFTFYLKDSPWPKYLAAVYLDAEKIYFADADQDRLLMVDQNTLLRNWSGEAYLIWKNFLNLQDVITPQSQGDGVKTLKAILQQLGYRQLKMTGSYDKESFDIIKHIQKKNGVEADGLVGPLTKIILYNESPSFVKPSLAVLEGSKREDTN
jgi:general secretion pathway protein A